MGLNPYEDSEKKASALGVRACEIACCITLSLAVGIPSFLTPPLGLGISFRLTGVGSYVRFRIASAISFPCDAKTPGSSSVFLHLEPRK